MSSLSGVGGSEPLPTTSIFKRYQESLLTATQNTYLAESHETLQDREWMEMRLTFETAFGTPDDCK
jgi:hypothetical protein